MMDVIAEAHAKRYKLQEGDESKKGILLTEAWAKELVKHPYLSRNNNRRVISFREARLWHLLDQRERQAL